MTHLSRQGVVGSARAKAERFLRGASAALLLSATLAAAPACAPRSRVYVRVGPPAPIIETRVVAPGPGFVWIPGYHRWTGSAYLWVPGRWDRPPRARAVWVPGRWVHSGRRGWYFAEGHWR
jgi:WXXGXW repeat (2 copies)